MALWEWCTRRRLAILVGVLITFSLFILLFEEYVEDSLANADKLLRRQSTNALLSPLPPATQQICTPPANSNSTPIAAVLTQQCQPCSDFELKAMQSEHCRPTGFFDTYTCTADGDDPKTNTTYTIYRPCLSKSRTHDARAFYVFSLFSIGSAVVFGLVVRWRLEWLERRTFSYGRLPNNANIDS